MKNISFDCKTVTRALIGLLFVVAGLSKIGMFGSDKPVEVFKSFYSQLPIVMDFIPVSLAGLVGLAVVIIEIPIVLLYVAGYKKNWTGGVIIAFTILVTIFFHNPFTKSGLDFTQMVQALKNIAIIGGILATLDCICTTCKVGRSTVVEHKTGNHQGHSH